MKYVLPLAGKGEQIPALWEAGNKAAALGRVSELTGVKVPAGFALTFPALEDSLEEAGARAAFESIQRMAEAGGPAEASTHATRLRELVLQLPFAEAFGKELVSVLLPWVDGRAVSVRSSSNLEDAGNLSFAGQHDSLLNVRGEQGLREAVSAVWASAFTDRAVTYLLMLGRSLAELRMGVVIQEMVQARAAGVAFTVHPVTGARDVIHISAAFGLGEVTVSGEVTPDEAVVAREGFVTSSYTAVGETPVLDAANCATVAEAALLIERSAGGNPMDVEFAFDDAGLWILQARPMVVKRSDEDALDWSSPIPGANWQRNWRLGEWLPHAITPLFGTWMLPRLVASREEFGTGALGWGDMETFSMPQPWFILINGYFYTRTDYPDFGGGGQSIAERIERMRKSTERVKRWRDEKLPAYVELHESRRGLDLAAMSDDALLDYVDQLVAEAGEFWSFIAPIGYGFEEMVFRPIYDRVIPGDDKPHHGVLFGGYPSRMTESNAELHDLAGRVRADPDAVAALEAAESEVSRLPDWLREAVDAHDARYGHQVLSLDTYWPTLGETPEHTLRSLRVLVATDVPSPKAQLEAAAAARDEAVAGLYARLEDSPGKLDGFRTTIGFYQGNAAVREDCNFYLQAGWPHIRRALALLGERLVGRGILDDPEEVHFVEHAELTGSLATSGSGASASSLVQVARGRMVTWQHQRDLSAPMQIGEKATIPAGQWDEATATLAGNGASPGVATGPARVLLTADDAHRVRQGDVLILKAASPLFTPVMLIAGALVVEVGGGASHSSLIARELGLPAVVSATDATTRFADGDVLSVDGTRGTITRSQSSP